MKLYDIYRTLNLAAVLLAVASCSKDAPVSPAGTEPERPIAITITDGGYASDTRSMENGYSTEFTAGDACGLYVVRGEKTIYSNVKLTAVRDDATGGIVWKPEDGVTLAGGLPDEHYYLYYPYQTKMDYKTAAITGSPLTAAEFFAPLIASWWPQGDQSTYAAYTASDLMTADGTAATGANNTLQLSFSMTHHMALVVIDMPKYVYKFTDERVPDYTLYSPITFADNGGGKPLDMKNGTYRFLVTPIAPSAMNIEGSFDDGDSRIDLVPSDDIAAGTYKRYVIDDAKMQIENYTIQRGDFLLTDGRLLPKGTNLSEEQKAKVAGIVFWTPAETDPTGRQTPATLTDDKILAKEFLSGAHGLAVSIRKISASDFAWQKVVDPVADFQSGPDFNPVDKADYTSVQYDEYNINFNRILGYQNTKVLLAYNDYCTTNGKTDNLVIPVELLKTFAEQNPAPANSTGWYIPSMKEMHMLIYKDVDNIQDANDFNESYIETSGIVDASISAVGGDIVRKHNNPPAYWSSSEIAAKSTFYMLSISAAIYSTAKTESGNMNARAVCAF